MRAYRKRSWAPLVVDMTPLIDVIFLIIIFFIILINFSQIHIRNVLLPHAEEAVSAAGNEGAIVLTIRARDALFLDGERITLATLPRAVAERTRRGADLRALIRADEAVPFELVRQAMLQFASLGIDRVDFATWAGAPAALADVGRESR